MVSSMGSVSILATELTSHFVLRSFVSVPSTTTIVILSMASLGGKLISRGIVPFLFGMNVILADMRGSLTAGC